MREGVDQCFLLVAVYGEAYKPYSCCLHFNAPRTRKRDTGNESCTGRRRIIYLHIKTRFHAVICLCRTLSLRLGSARECEKEGKPRARTEPRGPAFYPVIPVATGGGSGKEFRFFLPSFLPSFVADKLCGILGALTYFTPVCRCIYRVRVNPDEGTILVARRPSRRYYG